MAAQITDLQTQQASLQDQEEKLTLAAQRLQAKVDAFRTRKETIKATYTAAEAQTRITEAVTGIGEEMGDVGLAMQRAQDKTEQMQARAGALDELIASGALEDATLPAGRDDIQAELEAVTAGQDVEVGAGPDEGPAPGLFRPAGGGGRRTPEGPAGPEGDVMIMRILGEGQYEIADEHLTRLNELDSARAVGRRRGRRGGVHRRPVGPAGRGAQPRHAAAGREDHAVRSGAARRGHQPARRCAELLSDEGLIPG